MLLSPQDEFSVALGAFLLNAIQSLGFPCPEKLLSVRWNIPLLFTGSRAYFVPFIRECSHRGVCEWERLPARKEGGFVSSPSVTSVGSSLEAPDRHNGEKCFELHS